MAQTEHEKARAWRERHDLSREQLAQLTGYSYEAVVLFEKGLTPVRKWKGTRKTEQREIKPEVWQRWKRVCAGVEAMLRERKHFNW